jgi:histidinol-phosphatase (PHP family)
VSPEPGERASGATGVALSSLHTHSRYCDGRGEIREYAEAALAAGLGAYGASGHAPLPFQCDYAMPLASVDAYRDDVRGVRDEIGTRLPVYLGLELDYVPGLGDFYAREFLSRGFDYFVASVHYVGEPGAPLWAYDESEDAFIREIRSRHHGDARPAVEDYYRRVCLMADEVSQWGVPIIVGHLDRVGLWNRDARYFRPDDDWHDVCVDEALRAIARAGCVLEINTSGWSKPLAAPNPGREILARAARLGIPVIVSADAHRPTNVDFRYADGVAVLRQAGYEQVAALDGRRWNSASLPTLAAEGAG